MWTASKMNRSQSPDEKKRNRFLQVPLNAIPGLQRDILELRDANGRNFENELAGSPANESRGKKSDQEELRGNHSNNDQNSFLRISRRQFPASLPAEPSRESPRPGEEWR